MAVPGCCGPRRSVERILCDYQPSLRRLRRFFADDAGRVDVLQILLPIAGNLLQRGIIFDYSVPQALRWGLLPAVLAASGLVVGLWRRKNQRPVILSFSLVVVVPLLLQLSISAPFWTRLPLVNFLQFPWRLQTFVALGGAILIGALPSFLRDHRNPPLTVPTAGLAGCWPMRHLLPLPADTPPGAYQLWVGMYDPATGERFDLLVDAPGQDRLLIGTVTVQ